MSQFVGALQHSVRRSPSDIAMEGDPKWFWNLALKLELLKILDLLSG